MIIRSKELLTDGQVSSALLLSVVEEHATELPRLEKLRRYYENDSNILDRKRTNGLPNTKIAHGYPRYISTMAAGYLIGSPVEYDDPDQRDALEPILSEYARANIESVDAEIAKNASIYGVGVEILYVAQRGEVSAPRTVAVDPETAFVVYDETVDRSPVFGVYMQPTYDERGDQTGWRISVYTDRTVSLYLVSGTEQIAGATPVSVLPHYFGEVPVNEYWNGEDERGDFESVIPLIDAYDILESDRVNDKQQFVDSLLVLTGCSLEEDENGRSPGQQLREDKVISIPGDGASVQWLSKTLTESDVDVLRQALNSDIHKMSMVPDLTDEHFAGNSSGVAMKYKLLGFEQMTKIKERWFKEGLRARLRMFAEFLRVRGEPALDADSVGITFHRGLPVNELEDAQTLSTLTGAGAVSPEEKVRRLHNDWTEDQVQDEVRKIQLANVFELLSELQSRGMVSKAELRAYVVGESDAEAQAAVDEIAAEHDTLSGIFAQDGEDDDGLPDRQRGVNGDADAEAT